MGSMEELRQQFAAEDEMAAALQKKLRKQATKRSLEPGEWEHISLDPVAEVHPPFERNGGDATLKPPTGGRLQTAEVAVSHKV